MDFIPFQLNIKGKLLDLSSPIVMAIVNVTPDSFYSLSRMKTEKDVLKAVDKALKDGASMIDVGAYSTRPTSKHISETEEMERLVKPLKAIRNHFPDVIISLDTFRSGVARWAVENFDVNIINDVSGGTLDDRMFETVADLQIPYVLMHMKGTPQTMQQLTDYENMMAEILDFFVKRTARLVHLGVKDIIIDPGFGFSKTTEQNYELLAKMNYFKELEFPILYGISRKSMIYKLFGTTPEEALNGTTALNVLGMMNGANILRVHDVKEAVEAVKIFSLYQRYQQPQRL
ncbi:MAG: dihydropteroate synthase [Bacteroidales bacterium]|nr:dihydropteroate synthase [Bacteroidales bacterium]